MKNNIAIAILCALLISSCVENPNVTEEVYLSNPNATSSWITGLKRQLAITTNTVNINVAITSDNYFNNYSQYSKVFDALQISFIDVDVNALQADVQALREMASYGIETILPSDDSATEEDEAYMYMLPITMPNKLLSNSYLPIFKFYWISYILPLLLI
ncbi:hypothetical protein [Leeuwenhoekiella marinoflava]|uniref:Uncharacterized protein n=2 Tax=Leeuwenhoekiella marinoflava TaxID=988 RepID=A0A4Q0PQD0_9FLAO|nr:hypothetical protein [Leeuwenhoekiella marinoflava]RXG32422.1 hypothetical protein DSL99_744 [Leeuwenhoekiella marinoflava]SHE72271.1 hypothetical protein SAMN02745246_00931 [Leeuwenhoekiella marinoflava DSM 3653]